MNSKQYWLPLLATLTFSLACSNSPDPSVPAGNTDAPIAEEAASTSAPATEAAASHIPVAAQGAQGALLGPVIETMDSGGYTYVQIQTVDGLVWAAGPPTNIEVGQVVEIKESFPMTDFSSATLSRTFEQIYFCSAIVLNDVGLSDSSSHMQPSADATGDAAGAEVSKADGGQTVEQVILGKDEFIGKAILIRGSVAKFTADIMGKNWIHLRDGSGSEGTNDLTITTSATAAVGDIVLIKGTLTADKDFGFGYKYDLIVEDAEVTVE
jgi:hypothetical protein